MVETFAPKGHFEINWPLKMSELFYDQDSFALVNRPIQDYSFPESGKFEISKNWD